MKLNREQIIKALECCTDGARECDDCPLIHDNFCGKHILRNTLSLIKELTDENENLAKLLDEEVQETNQLSEENERLLTDRFAISVELKAMSGEVDKLTEENERLRADNEQYRKATEKSVKRMQDKIMVEYEEQIDKIKAKLEGTK